MFVIGTAGHVDHGKSTLIKSLTGIDPDRLREEKERQMTIDLGFAWLKLPDSEEIGIVDVPGHRDFIDNMLAGSGGIDATLFVIAADEGIMPQSREHLSILELLDIKYGIIVLTKIDLVSDPEWLDMIKADIKNFVAGTFLENSDIMEVSANTGTGIDELVEKIALLSKMIIPKPDLMRPRLPVDRVFSLKGFGTIVTGTLLDGQFALGQQVEILPQKLKARIRGIQSHKKAIEIAGPGSRTALNLVGVDLQDIFRGNTVASIGLFKPTRRIDVQFRMLKDIRNPLLHDDVVKFFVGTDQSLARVRLIAKDALTSGSNGWLQLELEKPIIVAKGDRFILRRPSPGETLGGGLILEENPKKRLKRFSDQSLSHFELLETGSDEEILFNVVDTSGPKTVQAICERTGSSIDSTVEIIKEKLSDKLVVLNTQTGQINLNSIVTSKRYFEQVNSYILAQIKDFHKKFPLRQGIQKDELRRSVNLSPRLFSLFSDLLINRKELVSLGDFLFLPNHSTDFCDEDIKTVQKMIEKISVNPYSPPSLNDLNHDFGLEIVNAMIYKGLLIQTSDDIVFLKKDFDSMLTGLNNFLERENVIALNQFRDLFGTSRKYALSFLEYLDKKGITKRDGDKRALRSIDRD